MNTADDFLLWLRQLRAARRLTVEALAARAGCAPQTLALIEAGRSRPSPDLAARLADALAVPADDRAAFLLLARPPTETATASRGAALTRYTLRPTPPTPPTPFIGRAREQALVLERLAGPGPRLVTVVGPGGAGKTRLALQVAAAIEARLPDGAAFVPLAPVARADLVPEAIAAALDEPLRGAAAPVEQLLDMLRERDMLLTLDNAEHLPQLGELVARILAAAPRVPVLVTSRRRVGLQAEWAVELGGLGLAADTPAGSEAARLFVERARRASASFALDDSSRAAVAQICRHLEGLPLALELAAAQAAWLAPAAILARLDRALPLLESDARDLPERQRTMRAAIDWSYALLADDERALLARLAVFPRGWDLAAAEAVAADEAIGPAQVPGLLRRLVGQSLVLAEPAGDAARFRLLEPIRQYLAEHLAAQPAEEAAARDRHAAYMLDLAARAAPALQGAAQLGWLERLEREYHGLCAAMEHLLARGDLAAAARLALDLWLFLWLRGHFGPWRRWVEQILAQPARLTPAVRGRAMLAANVLAFGQGEYEQVAPRAAEALALYRTLDDPHGLADAVAMAGLAAMGVGEGARAEPLLAEGVERYLALGSRWSAAVILGYWSTIPLGRGDDAGAAALIERSLAISRAIGDRVAVYGSLFTLSRIADRQGDSRRAVDLLGEAAALAVEMGDDGNLSACLGHAAAIAALSGQDGAAARLSGAQAGLGDGREPAVYAYAAERAAAVAALAAARARGDAATWQSAWAAGRGLPRERLPALITAVAAGLPDAAAPPTPPPADQGEPLTAREREVLLLLAAGHGNQAIAERLVVAVGTVKRHLNSIFAKLGARTRTEAVARARARGLI